MGNIVAIGLNKNLINGKIVQKKKEINKFTI